MLEAVYAASKMDADTSDPRGPMTKSAGINSILGREPADGRIDQPMRALKEAGYIDGYRSGEPEWVMCRVLPLGLQVVAGWPAKPGDDTIDRLLAVLDQRIADSPSENERTRLQRLRDGVTGVGREVLTDVLSKIATSQI